LELSAYPCSAESTIESIIISRQVAPPHIHSLFHECSHYLPVAQARML
jgi:hypothetical protein